MELTLKFSTNKLTRCRICKGELPVEYNKKTCHTCLAKEKQRDVARRQKRKFEEIENTVPGVLPAKVAKKDLQVKRAPDVEFNSKEDLLQQLRLAFEVPSGRVIFRGYTTTAIDPMASAKEITTMVAADVWRVSGYRFRIHDSRETKEGCTTRFWCCQDERRKHKSRPSEKQGVKHRDTLGLRRFDCNSDLCVSCTISSPTSQQIAVRINHSTHHIPYFDVSVPKEVVEMVRRDIDWALPNDLTRKIQQDYPAVTSKQIMTIWTKLAQELWKRKPGNQMESASILLKESDDVTDLFVLEVEEGVDQLAWGMKKIAHLLGVGIVEVGIDATYNTNSRNLELYSIIAEHDNAGFPLSYCLLSTATAIEPRKRIRALSNWISKVKETYRVNPTFVHVDKDMAEIHAVKEVWDPKVQLCWWHLRKAVRERLKNTKLSTTPYKPAQANTEFPFIDISFVPLGKADAAETEGLIDSDDEELASGTRSSPIPSLPRQFCPPDLREAVVELIEKHFCAHPLIPGYTAPDPLSIRHWAVKRIYGFCQDHDLRELWAYLWENWYRVDRWGLWARSAHPEIPRLKTTMMVEAHWRTMKTSYLEHFHKPRLDLLVYTLVRKLAPLYYSKLELTNDVVGRYRELAPWRKEFKSAWMKDLAKDQNVDLHDKYRPDPQRWVCTCPHFVISRFLICKHLVQSVRPVTPEFFFEVERSRTTPFYSHPCLVESSLDGDTSDDSDGDDTHNDGRRLQGLKPTPASAGPVFSTLPPFTDPDPDQRFTTAEALIQFQREASIFVNEMMPSQIQYSDPRWLSTLERECAGFKRLYRTLADVEKRFNSTRSDAPTTWDPKTSKAMFYRPRPPACERET